MCIQEAVFNIGLVIRRVIYDCVKMKMKMKMQSTKIQNNPGKAFLNIDKN